MRTRPILLIAALVVTSCGGSDDTTPSATTDAPTIATTVAPATSTTSPEVVETTSPEVVETTSTPEPPTSTTPMSTIPGIEVAEAALLQLSDFPEGWTAIDVPDEEFGGELAEARTAFVACVGSQGTRVLEFTELIASSDEFTSPAGDAINHSVAIAPPAEAEAFMSRFNADGVAECLTDAAKWVMEAGFSQAPANGEAVIGDVTVTRLDLIDAGEEIGGYRIHVPLELSGLEIDVYIDIVGIRVGGMVSGLQFNATMEPFSDEDIDHYVAIAAERMTG